MTEERYQQLLKESEEWTKTCRKITDKMHKEHEEYEETMRPIREVEKKRHQEEEARRRALKAEREANLPHEQRFHGWCDHPNTMENSTATVFWLVAMVVSLLFKGGWALCILETIIWWKFITRHK